jgi:hypothetical protein
MCGKLGLIGRDIKNVPENVMQMIVRRKRLLKELAPVFDDLTVPVEKSLFVDGN